MDRSENTSTLTTLVGAVTHDLMNAITVVSCDVGLALSAHTADDELSNLLRQADEAAHQAEELVKSLMAFVRPTQTHLSSCDLSEVVTRSARLLRRAVPPDMTLNVEGAGGPMMVRGDAYLLEYAVVSLTLRLIGEIARGGEIHLRARVGPVSGRSGGNLWSESTLVAVLTVEGRPATPGAPPAADSPESFSELCELTPILTSHDARCTRTIESSGTIRYELSLPLDGSSEAEGQSSPPQLAGGIVLVSGDLMTQALLRSVLEGRRYGVRAVSDLAEAALLIKDRSAAVAALVLDAATVAGWETGLSELRKSRPNLLAVILGKSEPEGVAEDPSTIYLPQPYTPHDLLDALGTSSRKG